MSQDTTRRDVVKKVTILVGGVATLIELPARWTKPVVESNHRAGACRAVGSDDDYSCADDDCSTDDNNYDDHHNDDNYYDDAGARRVMPVRIGFRQLASDGDSSCGRLRDRGRAIEGQQSLMGRTF